ncbi:helix-turn-helix transcriptional regulator [Bradyrhizobium sp. BR 1432]|uniref:helix-turn-helix transcriptional regulator n=1 Tax=Bradyrhizobium sp. BR 1432 TaxID=3447966 RepID=UPI003EE6C707
MSGAFVAAIVAVMAAPAVEMEFVMIAANRREAEAVDDALDDGARPQPMLTEQEILRLIPIGRATLFRMMKEGTFPKGTFVSKNRRLWLSSEIARWQREVDAYVPARRRGKGKGRGRRALGGPA